MKRVRCTNGCTLTFRVEKSDRGIYMHCPEDGCGRRIWSYPETDTIIIVGIDPTDAEGMEAA